MNNTRFNVRTTFGKSRNRGLFAAGAIAIGILFFMITIYSGNPVVTTKVQAAGQTFRGGATPEMLAFALNLKGASQYAVYGGRAVHNHGNSVFRGDVGSAGTVDGVAGASNLRGNGQAKQDLSDSIRAIDQLPCEEVDDSGLAGKTFTAGVYCLSSANLAGVMTLNGNGDPNAIFVFRVNGTFTTGENSTIALQDGASATNSYFVSSGDVNVAAGSDINSNILSSGTVTIADSSRVSGKTLGTNGDVTVTNSVLGAGTGSVEICKALAPGETTIAAGTVFTFNVSGVASPILVPAGACSAPFDVAVGNATITEAVRANTAVVGIAVNPSTRLVSSSFGLRQAVVAIPEGGVADQTVVTFTNQTTRTGTLEICKQGLDTGVTGMFTFTVQGLPGQTFAVPVGFCSNPITTTIVQTPESTFTALVTELARPNFRLENVTVIPTNRSLGFALNIGFDPVTETFFTNTNGGVAQIGLVSGGGASQATIVNFINRSLPGRIKVCKITADPVNIPQGTLFRFSVSGTAPTSPTQTTPGVPVTLNVDVPAGPAAQGGFCQFVDSTFVIDTPVTVTETGLTPGQSLPNGLTFADTRVSRIRSSTTLTSSSLAGRTATFNAVNTTTEVEFTNFIFRPAVLKICKIAGAGVATGTNFTFNLSLVDPLTSFPLPSGAITVPAGSCTLVANGPFPGIQNFPGAGVFNANTQIVVTEVAAAGVNVTAIASPSGNPITVSLGTRAGTLTLNQLATAGNINEIAITNAAVVIAPSFVAKLDFDGDGKSDPVLFRPSTGDWWYAESGSNNVFHAQKWGIAGDVAVAADYDGDGITDYAIYRAGEWYVNASSAGFMYGRFGTATDIPQVGDYDGDGKADFVVYRPSEGNWYYMLSTGTTAVVHFGISTDRPVAADYDGDGKTDTAVYRAGTWYILGTTSGFHGFQWGISTDLPVVADYDGDRKADAAIYRNGDWYILRSSDGGFSAFTFGTAGDIPVQADYDGDGKTDPSVYRPSTNMWFVNNAGGLSSGGFHFGSPGDLTVNY